MTTKRNRSGNILLIDNDVLVNIFVDLRKINEEAITRVVRYITLEYARIWIPAYIKTEFLLKRNDKRRSKILKKVFEAFENFSECPIYVSLQEVRVFVGMKDQDMGEAEAILQMQKAKSLSTCRFNNIVFLSNDQAALALASNWQMSTYNYAELKSTMREAGILLP